MLDPRLWIEHRHQELAGYQGVGGVMNSCMWTWMFTRWVRKFWIGDVEKNGSPLVYGKVKKDTKKEVRDRILSDLENLSADHVGVIEEGTEIVVEAAAQAAASTKHEDYMRFSNEGLAKAWLGSSDMVEPGANGSQAAVSTRAGATADPRMVTDGRMLCTSIRGSLFKQLIRFNTHRFGGVSEDKIPVPLMRLKTAHDEVRPDLGGAAADMQATVQGRPGDAPAPDASKPATGEERDVAAIVRESIAAENAPPAATPEAGAGGAPPGLEVQPGASVQQQALNGAQVTSLLELLTAVSENRLPRESAIELITSAFPIDLAKAERIMGTLGAGFVPAPPKPAAPPPWVRPQGGGGPPEPDDAAPPDPKASASGEPGPTPPSSP